MAQRRKRDYASTLPRPLPAEVARTSLLERVTRADDANLVVLVAPSGYGKTTFLGQLARASRHPAWLTLSERHTELKALSDDLITSIAQVAEEATFERVRKAVAEGAQVGALATSLARELDELTINLRILVDQANLLSSDALAWLESFALALGEGHQLVYCAYDLASERLAAPLASGQALLLTTPDLAFTEDETRAYLSARGSSADVYQVQRDLEGWPAGVGLVAAGVEHVLSHDDLLSAAFDRLPEDVRKALPEASVMEVWREADARRLGCNLPEGWLREARRAGLPMTPLSAQAYRPHTLVLEMLDRELRGRAERYRELHARAGCEAQEHNDLLLALQHFYKAGHIQKALSAAETFIPLLGEQQEFLLICKLLAPFAKHNLSSALASYYGGALLYSGSVAQAEEIFKQLYDKKVGNRLVFQALAKIASDQGNKKRSLELIDEGIVHLRKSGDDSIKHLELHKIGYIASSGRFEEALNLACDWMHRVELNGSRNELAIILGQLGQIYAMTGENEAREIVVLRALAILKDLQRLETHNAFLLFVNLAQLYRIQNRLSEALDVVKSVIPIAERKNKVWLSFLAVAYADILTDQLRFEEAAVQYQRAIKLFDQHGAVVDAQTARYQLSDVARLSGDYKLSRRALAETRQVYHHEYALIQGLRDFYEALESFSQGDLEVACRQFNSAETTLEPEIKLRGNAYALDTARRRGILNFEQVTMFIKKLDAFGHDHILWIDAEPLKHLYEELVALGWYAERFAPFTKPPPVYAPQPAQPTLLVQTFEDAHLSLNGKPVKLPFAKAAELLVWLALNGPVTREQIIDALWDGSRDPKHVEYGKLALRRLRTVLAEHVPFNPLVYEGRQYRLADELEVKLDAQELLKAFEAGDDIARREALERYNGTFLPGVTSEWAELMRVKLHDAAVATAMGLGASHERNDLDLALWAYRKAVELEPLFLDGHRALVQLLQASGDQVGARLAYQTYLRVLTTEYGETPNLSFDDLLSKTQDKHLN